MEWLGRVFTQLHLAFDGAWYVHSGHALTRQTERGISNYDIEDAICADRPEIIENAPNYWKGPAVLIRGVVHNRTLHILCTLDNPPLFVTCYFPDPKLWYAGFRKRRR